MSSMLRVAAVQMDAEAGMAAANLARAERYVEEAAAKGARIILLPELLPSGYIVTEDAWNHAEPMDGPSVRWLRETAKRLNVYVGFSFLEAEGEHFYNSFVLAAADGTLCRRIRKNPPASIEAYFYRAGSDRHVIETEFGRVGVGICYENLLYGQMCEMFEENVDLILSPAAAGYPKPFLPGDTGRFDRMLIGSRRIFAETLRVPVVMANRTGLLETELPGRMPYLKTRFAGLSSIVDHDGTVMAALNDEEGVLVADVTLRASERPARPPRCYGKMWAMPVPWYAFLWPMSQKWGEESYAANPRRRERALAVSGSGSGSSASGFDGGVFG